MTYQKKPKKVKIDKAIKEIGDSLPHGAKKEIAELSGVSEQTVVKYFKGEKVRPELSAKILTAAQKYVDEAIETEKEVQRLKKTTKQLTK